MTNKPSFIPWCSNAIVVDSKERNPYRNTAFFYKRPRASNSLVATKAARYINGSLLRLIWRSRREGNA